MFGCQFECAAYRELIKNALLDTLFVPQSYSK